MAHKKAGGSTRNGRDSNPKYLGVKIYGGQAVEAGNSLVRGFVFLEQGSGTRGQGLAKAPSTLRQRIAIAAALANHPSIAASCCIVSVSYTHLRAHETPEHL